MTPRRAVLWTAALMISGAALAAPDRPPMPPWEPSLEAGLAAAKKRNCALLVVLNMDQERGNQQMVDEVYTSKVFNDAAQHCVVAVASMFKHPALPDTTGGKTLCSRFGSVSCDEHRAIEETVRRDWLKKGPKDDVISPQHFLLAPDGRMLFQRKWTLSAERLAGMMKRASELCTPGVLESWNTREGRLSRAADPNTDIREEALDGLLAEKDADLDKQLLALAKKTKDVGTIGSIASAFARCDTPERRALAHPFLTHKSPEVRRAAAYAMERSAAADHAKPLLGRVSKDKDDRALGCICLAVVACAPEDDDVRSALLKVVKNKKTPGREHATTALAHWADEKAVHVALAEVAFDQGSKPHVRWAAVWGLGKSGEKSYRDPLKELKATLSRWDHRFKGNIDRASDALKSAPDDSYDGTLRWTLNHPADEPRDYAEEDRKYREGR